MTHSAYIRGTGFHVPPNIMTNADLEKIVETNDEWIQSRTGIKQRHIADAGETCSDLATEAAKKALADAGMDASELTHIVLATLTPDGYCPAAAPRVQDKLGVSGLMCFDLSAACSGFLYSLQVARGLTCIHPGAKVMVVASEVLSSRLNWEDRTTCVIFGDGASAAIVTGPEADQASPGPARIVDSILKSDGAHADLLTVNGGGSSAPYKLGETVGEDFFIQMKGSDVFKVAVRSMTAVSLELLAQNDLSGDDVDVFISHQANSRIIDAVRKKLKMPQDKVFINVDKYGNTSAASVGIALDEARQSGLIQPGHKVLLTTFGGGFTWGSTLLQF